jgi:hypothetical protein
MNHFGAKHQIISELIFLIFIVTAANPGKACEACNRLFLAQLQGKERAGTLVSKELLATIAAQEHIGRNNPAGSYPIAPGSPPIVAQNLVASSQGVQSRPAQRLTAQSLSVLDGLDDSVDFNDIIRRDYRMPLPPTSFVPQHTEPDRRVRITLQ